MRAFIAGIVITGVLLGCSVRHANEENYLLPYDAGKYGSEIGRRIEQIWYSAVNCSLVSLIANPDRFDGRSVRVVGIMKSTELGVALFMDRESYEYHVISNSIVINLKSSYFDPAILPLAEGHYVDVVGLFDRESTNGRYLVNGMLKEVLPILPGNVSVGKIDHAKP